MAREDYFAFFNFHYSLTIHDPCSASRSWIVLGRQSRVRLGQARAGQGYRTVWACPNRPQLWRATGSRVKAAPLVTNRPRSVELLTEASLVTQPIAPTPRSLAA